MGEMRFPLQTQTCRGSMGQLRLPLQTWTTSFRARSDSPVYCNRWGVGSC